MKRMCEPFAYEFQANIFAPSRERTTKPAVITKARASGSWQAGADHLRQVETAQIGDLLQPPCRTLAELAFRGALGIRRFRRMEANQPVGPAMRADCVAVDDCHVLATEFGRKR